MKEQTTVIQKYYDSIALDYAEEWYKNNSLSHVLKLFISLFQSNPKILDMGCGAGYHSRTMKLLGADVIGIDISEKAIQIARELNPDGIFEVMDFRSISLESRSFDGVISIATFMHIPYTDLPNLFRHLEIVLNENGYFLLVINDGNGKSEVEFHCEQDGKHYNFINHFHSLEKINEVAMNEGLFHMSEWKLPEELYKRGWRCHLYQLL